MPEELEPVEEGDDAAWLATFADLMSLLLCFFVLLLSFAEMDIVKFRDALGSVRMALGYADAYQSLNLAGSTALIKFDYKKKDSNVQQPLDMKLTKRARQKVVVKSKQNEAILKRVKATVKNNNLEGYVKVQNTGRGVVVRVKGQLLFKSGSAVLKKTAYPLLDEIIGIAEEYPYDMSVEGHTDSTPITSSKFPSNWELSTARAISTLRYIMDSGRISFERLGASGYADTRPIDSNDIIEGRQNNRRVEFIFYQQ